MDAEMLKVLLKNMPEERNPWTEEIEKLKAENAELRGQVKYLQGKSAEEGAGK